MQELSTQQSMQIAMRQFQEKDFSSAWRICYQAMINDPNQPELLNLSAVVSMKLKEYARAENLLNNAISLAPNMWACFINLALLHAELGNSEKTLWYYSALLAGISGIEMEENPVDFFEKNCRFLSSNQGGLPSHYINVLSDYSKILNDLGLLLENSERIIRLLEQILFNRQLSTYLVRHILRLIAFEKTSNPDWNSLLFERIIIPYMQNSLDHSRYDILFLLEECIYAQFVKQTETEEHFSYVVGRQVPIMREAGLRVSQLPDLKPLSPSNTERPRLVFFVHMASMLAHIQVLLSYLEGYRKIDDQPFTPTVIIFAGTNEILSSRLNELGITAHFFDDVPELRKLDTLSKMIALRNILLNNNVTAIVWVSLALGMAFAFSMGMAPVQIWWAMKYHSVELPEIDGYITGGSLCKTKRIGERVWRTAPVGMDNLFDPALEKAAIDLRCEKFNFDTVLGSIGREEKLSNPEFLNAICDLLEKHGNTAFIWTGNNQLSSIQAVFEKRGVSDRTFYVGWIDTKLYAQVIDIFLDSFPFPCGITAVEAMAAKKPVVLFKSNESYETGMYGIISPVLDGNGCDPDLTERMRSIFHKDECLYLCAENATEYVSYADRLILEKEYRREVGLAYKTFVDTFLSNPLVMAEEYTRHFSEVMGIPQ